MAYQPLTPEQYKSARSAGFSPEKIIQMEQVRKSQSEETSSTAPPASKNTKGGLEKFTDFIGAKGLTDYISTGIAKATAPTKAQADAVKSASGKAAIGSALQVAPFLLPFGTVAKGIGLAAKGLGLSEKAAALAGRIGSGAVGGYVNDIGSNLEQDKSVGQSFIPGAGTALGAAIPGVGVGIGALRRAAVPIKNGAQAVENILAKNAAGKVDSGAAKTLSTLEQDRLKRAGKIVLGERADQAIAAKTLPTIDTAGVKTYSELGNRLDSEVKKSLETVDREFASDVTPRKLKELTQTVKVGVGNKSLSGKINHVENALTQLGDYYKKTRDLPKALRIKGLVQKARNEGLTPSEINELAKEHGRNLNGFNANGELASGLSKQAAENTRAGLKNTARGFLTSDTAKQADKRASELIKTKSLVDDVAEKVNSLEQKFEKRNIFKKGAGMVGKALNIALGGTPKSFVQGMLLESNIAQKTPNYLAIQEKLAKNLKLLHRIEKAPDSAVPKLLQELLSKTGLTSLPRSPGDIILRK